jgi:hypothetical protein
MVLKVILIRLSGWVAMVVRQSLYHRIVSTVITGERAIPAGEVRRLMVVVYLKSMQPR